VEVVAVVEEEDDNDIRMEKVKRVGNAGGGRG
jgi:hypothetical protein